MGSTIRVEVVYALPEGEDCVTLEMPRGATIREALIRSGIAERHPEIDLARQMVGIHGRVVAVESVPADRDRIEIYRALAMDPKAARRLRAAKSRRA